MVVIIIQMTMLSLFKGTVDPALHLRNMGRSASQTCKD